LETLADLTENWSGAELRGIIVNALFESSRDLPDSPQPVISTQSLKSSYKSALESKNKTAIKQKKITGPRVSLA
jgi:hypothetical protein